MKNERTVVQASCSEGQLRAQSVECCLPIKWLQNTEY
jgi:hypothetical protein